MTAWQTYWLFQLDSLSCLLFFIGFLMTIASIFLCVMYGVKRVENHIDDEDLPDWHKWLKSFLSLTILVWLGTALCPSTKTMAAIIVLPKIASAENLDMVSKDVPEIYQLAMQKLKDTLKDEPMVDKS